MDKLILVGVFGFIIQKLFLLKSRRNYSKQNTYEFIIAMLLWALPVYFLLEVTINSAKLHQPTFKFFSSYPDFINLAKLVTGIVYTSLISFLVTRNFFITRYLNFFNSLPNRKFAPQTSGFAEESFVKPNKMLLVSLRNGKIYVGSLIGADIKDSLPSDIKIVKLKTHYSFGRKGIGSICNSSKVDYLANIVESLSENSSVSKMKLKGNLVEYIDKEKIPYIDEISNMKYEDLSWESKKMLMVDSIESILEIINPEQSKKDNIVMEPEAMLDQEEVRRTLWEFFGVQELPTISIFQREIVTYSEFNNSLFEKFQGTITLDTENDSKNV